jgi:hypothetical protein
MEGAQKLGQPDFESNLLLESNNIEPQHLHEYTPFSLFCRRLPENGGSVPRFTHTSYSSGVNFFLNLI